jgi:hypothetical protein
MSRAIQAGLAFTLVAVIIAVVDVMRNPSGSPIRSTLESLRQTAADNVPALSAGPASSTAQPAAPISVTKPPSAAPPKTPARARVAADVRRTSAVRTPVAAPLPVNRDLSIAKGFYEKAFYEEALQALPDRPRAADRDNVELYRALSLIALGRPAEAEEAFGRILAANPSYALSATDVSPRVVAVFERARERVRPERVEALYARARADLAARRYEAAMAGFTEVQTMAAEQGAESGRLAELGRLSGEFLVLAAREAESGNPRVAPYRSSSSGDVSGRIYTMLDATVKPPVDLSRPLPPWTPPRDQAWRSFRGVIEVIVAEDGHVLEARMLERIAPFYDDALVEAAAGWRFKPALRDGAPVRFRHRIQIILRPPA